MVTLRQKVFLASRPLGRGDDTPRRESPEGPPNAVAMGGVRVWAAAAAAAAAAVAAAATAVGGFLGWGAAASLHLAAGRVALLRL